MATPSDFYSYPHDALHNQLLRPPSPAQQSLLEKRRKAGLGPRPEDCIKPLSLTLKQLRDGVPPEEALQPKLEGMKTFLENYIVRLPHGPGLAGHDMSECMGVCRGLGHSVGFHCRICSSLVSLEMVLPYGTAFKHLVIPDKHCTNILDGEDRRLFIKAIVGADPDARQWLSLHSGSTNKLSAIYRLCQALRDECGISLEPAKAKKKPTLALRPIRPRVLGLLAASREAVIGQQTQNIGERTDSAVERNSAHVMADPPSQLQSHTFTSTNTSIGIDPRNCSAPVSRISGCTPNSSMVVGSSATLNISPKHEHSRQQYATLSHSQATSAGKQPATTASGSSDKSTLDPACTYPDTSPPNLPSSRRVHDGRKGMPAHQDRLTRADYRQQVTEAVMAADTDEEEGGSASTSLTGAGMPNDNRLTLAGYRERLTQAVMAADTDDEEGDPASISPISAGTLRELASHHPSLARKGTILERSEKMAKYRQAILATASIVAEPGEEHVDHDAPKCIAKRDSKQSASHQVASSVISAEELQRLYAGSDDEEVATQGSTSRDAVHRTISNYLRSQSSASQETVQSGEGTGIANAGVALDEVRQESGEDASHRLKKQQMHGTGVTTDGGIAPKTSSADRSVALQGQTAVPSRKTASTHQGSAMTSHFAISKNTMQATKAGSEAKHMQHRPDEGDAVSATSQNAKPANRVVIDLCNVPSDASTSGEEDETEDEEEEQEEASGVPAMARVMQREGGGERQDAGLGNLARECQVDFGENRGGQSWQADLVSTSSQQAPVLSMEVDPAIPGPSEATQVGRGGATASQPCKEASREASTLTSSDSDEESHITDVETLLLDKMSSSPVKRFVESSPAQACLTFQDKRAVGSERARQAGLKLDRDLQGDYDYDDEEAFLARSFLYEDGTAGPISPALQHLDSPVPVSLTAPPLSSSTSTSSSSMSSFFSTKRSTSVSTPASSIIASSLSMSSQSSSSSLASVSSACINDATTNGRKSSSIFAFPPTVLPFVDFLKAAGIRDLYKVRGELSVEQVDSYVSFLCRRFPGRLDTAGQSLLTEALMTMIANE